MRPIDNRTLSREARTQEGCGIMKRVRQGLFIWGPLSFRAPRNSEIKCTILQVLDYTLSLLAWHIPSFLF